MYGRSRTDLRRTRFEGRWKGHPDSVGSCDANTRPQLDWNWPIPSMVSSDTLRADDVLVLFVLFLPCEMATIPARVVPFSSDRCVVGDLT